MTVNISTTPFEQKNFECALDDGGYLYLLQALNIKGKSDNGTRSLFRNIAQVMISELQELGVDNGYEIKSAGESKADKRTPLIISGIAIKFDPKAAQKVIGYWLGIEKKESLDIPVYNEEEINRFFPPAKAPSR